MAQIIPVTSNPNQTLQPTYTIDGGNVISLSLSLSFNVMAGYWVMSFTSAAGVLLVDSVPILGGLYPAGNILGQYGSLGIGSWWPINATGINQDSPGSTNLGTDWLILVDDTPVV